MAGQVARMGDNRDAYCNRNEYQKLKNNNVSGGPPLWSSGQSSWLQIWRSGFDSRQYQKKSENTAVGIRHADHVAPQKLAITSPTSGGRSVGVVRSRTQTMVSGVMCGWCVGLTYLPPSRSRLSRKCGILNVYIL
jgi:hypothetical protein